MLLVNFKVTSHAQSSKRCLHSFIRMFAIHDRQTYGTDKLRGVYESKLDSGNAIYSCIVDYDLDAASSVATTGNKLKNGVN